MYTLARNWWVVALQGALAVLFGLLVLLWPELAWIVVVASFAAFALLDGAFSIAAALTGHGQGRRWWALVLKGVLGISAGLLTLLWPDLTQLVLLFFIAFRAIATGVFEIIAAVQLRREIDGEWLLALSGFLSVLFGIALVIMPSAGALAIAWLIGAYAMVVGVLLLTLSFRLRTYAKQASRPHGFAAPS